MLNREMLRGLASTSGTGEPEAMAGEMELESRLQDVLFSELFTSVSTGRWPFCWQSLGRLWFTGASHIRHSPSRLATHLA